MWYMEHITITFWTVRWFYSALKHFSLSLNHDLFITLGFVNCNLRGLKDLKSKQTTSKFLETTYILLLLFLPFQTLSHTYSTTSDKQSEQKCSLPIIVNKWYMNLQHAKLNIACEDWQKESERKEGGRKHK